MSETNPNMTRLMHKYGVDALYEAVKNDDYDQAEWLFDNDVRIYISYYLWMLNEVLPECSMRMFHLVGSRMNICDYKDENGNTLLHSILTGEYPCISKITILIERSANTINAQTWKGNTPLHLLAYAMKRSNLYTRHHLNIAALLLINEANPNIKNSHGLTPLHVLGTANEYPNYSGDEDHYVRHYTDSDVNRFAELLLMHGAYPIQTVLINGMW